MFACEELERSKSEIVRQMAVLFEQNTELQQEIKILTRALELKDTDEAKVID